MWTTEQLAPSLAPSTTPPQLSLLVASRSMEPSLILGGDVSIDRVAIEVDDWLVIVDGIAIDHREPQDCRRRTRSISVTLPSTTRFL